MEGTRGVVRRLCHSSHQSQMAKTEDLFGPLSADHRKWRSQRAGDDSVVLASQLQGCGNIWNKCTICWAGGGLLQLCWSCFHLQVEGGYPEQVIYTAPLFGTPFCSGAFLWLMEGLLLSQCDGVLFLCLGAPLGWGQPLQTVPGVALHFVMPATPVHPAQPDWKQEPDQSALFQNIQEACCFVERNCCSAPVMPLIH